MRKLLLPVLFVGLLVGLGGAEERKKEAERIKGTWTFVSAERDGKTIPTDDLKDMTITFTGDGKFTVKKGTETVQAGTQKLDPSKKPAQVDSTVTEGENKGKTMLGVYELDGDTMKYCFDPEGKKRPTDTKGGPGLMCGTLKRQKP